MASPKDLGYVKLPGKAERYLTPTGEEVSKRQAYNAAREATLGYRISAEEYARARAEEKIIAARELAAIFPEQNVVPAPPVPLYTINEAQTIAAIQQHIYADEGVWYSTEQISATERYQEYRQFIENFRSIPRDERTGTEWDEYEEWQEELFGYDENDWEDTGDSET